MTQPVDLSQLTPEQLATALREVNAAQAQRQPVPEGGPYPDQTYTQPGQTPTEAVNAAQPGAPYPPQITPGGWQQLLPGGPAMQPPQGGMAPAQAWPPAPPPLTEASANATLQREAEAGPLPVGPANPAAYKPFSEAGAQAVEASHAAPLPAPPPRGAVPAAGPGLPNQSRSVSASYSSGPVIDYARMQALQAEGDRLWAEQQKLMREGKVDEAAALMRGVSADQVAQENFKANYEKGQARYDELMAKSEQYLSQLDRTSIDPNKYYKSMGALQLAGTAMSIIMGGILQGTYGMKENPGMAMLEKSVERDIKAQEMEMDKLVKQSHQAGQLASTQGNMQQEVRMFEALRRQQFWDLQEKTLKAEALKRGVPLDEKNFQMAYNAVLQQREAARIAAEQARLAAAAQAAKANAELRKWATAETNKLIASGKVGDDYDTVFANVIESATNSRRFNAQTGEPLFPAIRGITKGEGGSVTDIQQRSMSKANNAGLAIKNYAELLELRKNNPKLSRIPLTSENTRAGQLLEQQVKLDKKAGENSDLDREAAKLQQDFGLTQPDEIANKLLSDKIELMAGDVLPEHRRQFAEGLVRHMGKDVLKLLPPGYLDGR